MRTKRASLFLVVCISGCAVVYGCSSKSTSATSTNDDGGTTIDGNVDAGVDANLPKEAGPDVYQDPNIYPAMHAAIPQMNFLGGPVLSNPKVVTVTFNYATVTGTDGGTMMGDPIAGRLADFDDFITTSTYWTSAMSGFKVGAGTSGGHYTLPDTVSNTSIQDSDVQAFIAAQVVAGTLPPGDDQTIYAVYYPTTTTISLDGGVSCSNFAGYHESVTVNDMSGSPIQAAYAVLPECKYGGTATDDFNQLTATASHEFAEAASDPQPTENQAYYLETDDAWIPQIGLSFGGGECGDLCETEPLTKVGAYVVQTIWSNTAAAASLNPCQPSVLPTYYGAAINTTKITLEGHSSYGYLPVVRGKTITATMNFFTSAALPDFVNLYVGVAPQFGGTDPTALGPIPDGVTATLSETQASNGDFITLELDVPAKAVAGDYPFIVRSVESTTDYHDWPAILHITTK